MVLDSMASQDGMSKGAVSKGAVPQNMSKKRAVAAGTAARNLRKTREGIVVSAKMNKTIVVEQKRRVPHPLYKRYITLTKKYYAHDEANECAAGDVVRIMETRPLSKLKRWRLVSILEKAR